jgi:hypothetical protein
LGGVFVDLIEFQDLIFWFDSVLFFLFDKLLLFFFCSIEPTSKVALTTEHRLVVYLFISAFDFVFLARITY